MHQLDPIKSYPWKENQRSGDKGYGRLGLTNACGEQRLAHVVQTDTCAAVTEI